MHVCMQDALKTHSVRTFLQIELRRSVDGVEDAQVYVEG